MTSETATCAIATASSTTTTTTIATTFNYPTTADTMKVVFDSSSRDNSLRESSDDDRHWDDLLSLDHNPDNLFRYRRSMTPTLTQQL